MSEAPVDRSGWRRIAWKICGILAYCAAIVAGIFLFDAALKAMPTWLLLPIGAILLSISVGIFATMIVRGVIAECLSIRRRNAEYRLFLRHGFEAAPTGARRPDSGTD